MKKFLFLVMMVYAGVTNAQVQKEKPVTCYELDSLIQQMKMKYGESLFFSYPNALYQLSTHISMYTNKETGTWTLIEHNEDTGCILAVGKSNQS